MLRRTPVIIAIFFILLFSCKKSDVTADNNSGNTSGNVVYNVNKATLLQLINNVRQTGCNCGTTAMPAVPVLVWDDQLAKAAYNHSVDMKTNNYFSHTGLDNSDPGQRITAAGYTWQAYGENIANGFTSEQDVVNGWLNSEGHCKNMMGANFKDMGVGRDGNYWTQEFGAK